jgi:SAM-dependent methyltransferase
MRETAKCQVIRERRGEFDKYLNGSGIDIGCGNDVLRIKSGSVRGWDVKDGDANKMAGVPDATYDFVYSSHCLEHMVDVAIALGNWVRILKPGGILYTVVPDVCLYEKFTWPSKFNGDHKASFSLDRSRLTIGRPNHYHIENDIAPILSKLGVELLEKRLEDDGFNYNAGNRDQTLGNALAQICFIARKAAKEGA